MDEPSAFRGVACTACGATPEDAATITACPGCGGLLSTQYEFDGAVDPTSFQDRSDQYRFDPLLPVTGASAVTMGEGGTPLVECPSLAAEAGVDSLLIKDEGANPTGSIADRGQSLAVTAAAEADVETVALPSTGHGGRSAAAYAGRAGLTSETFVPARAPFDCKAMVNVHGGEMTVAGGKYGDAHAAFEDAREADWADLGPGSAYRRDGAVSLYGELLAALDWTAPDAIVVPTGHGTTVAGLRDAADRFGAAGIASETPQLVVAQPEGCQPVVEVITEDRSIEPVEYPDTIAGALEIPDPICGEMAADAVRETDGIAVALPDDESLAAAVETNAAAGVEVGVAGGVALAAATEVADELASDATVVSINPTAGGTESDVLRSHLMGQGK